MAVACDRPSQNQPPRVLLHAVLPVAAFPTLSQSMMWRIGSKTLAQITWRHHQGLVVGVSTVQFLDAQRVVPSAWLAGPPTMPCART